VTAGQAKIVVVPVTGTESVFGLRSPGVFIGDTATLNDERRSVDVVAVGAATAVMKSVGQLTRHLEPYSSVARALLRWQSRHLNEMTQRSLFGGLSVKARIAQRLL